MTRMASSQCYRTPFFIAYTMTSTPSTLRPSAPNNLAFRGKNVVMASHGRAPWYTPDGKVMDAYVIGIAGGSSSGKTSVARAICQALDNIPTVLILSQDAFYKKHTDEEVRLAFQSELDLDHPNSIDMEYFAECLESLKKGRATEIPVYSFNHHQRMPEKKYLYGASVIIVEGIMALQDPKMRDLYDLKLFVSCDSDLMLARRIRRDTVERGRDVEGILDQYLRFVKSSYDNFVQPSSRYADIIVPGYNNDTAIELLVTHVQRQLDSRTLRFRRELGLFDGKSKGIKSGQEDAIVDKHLHVLPQTNQLLGIMTILRDAKTTRSDFIFYVDRLSTLIVEKALTLLPHGKLSVRTPLGVDYDGIASCDQGVVGVSILRSGGPFANGLRRVIRDVPIGSMLIQSDPKTGEPLLLHCKLPHTVISSETSKDIQVLLMDSQMGTGAAALMAIRVLLDHGVPEDHITFLAFLLSRQAVQTVHRAFPAVRIVAAAIDSALEEIRIPINSGSTAGEAAGDADFGARLVADAEEVIDLEDASNARHDGKLLSFGRRPDAGKLPKEKVAWVVKPGMGQIGDRYYLA